MISSTSCTFSHHPTESSNMSISYGDMPLPTVRSSYLMYSEFVKTVLQDSRKLLHIHLPSLISLQKQTVGEWQLPKTSSKAGQKVTKLHMKEDQLASAACCIFKQHGNVPLSLGLHPIPPSLFFKLNFKSQLQISTSRLTASEG